MGEQITVSTPDKTKRKQNKNKKKYYNKSKTKPKPKQNSNNANSILVPQTQYQMDEQMTKLLKKYRAAVNAATTNNNVQLNPILRNRSLSYTNYTKSNYRTFMQNPKSNESKICEMSQFLARVCTPYFRILWYYATIPMFYWNLTPRINPVKDTDSEAILNEYFEVGNYIENMKLTDTLRTVMYVALRDGAYYGVVHENQGTFFLQKLDPKYCKPIALQDGVWNFAFDLSFFSDSTNKDFLEVWDSMFQEAYKRYEEDSTNYRWQILDPTRTICIKADPSNYNETLPFFVGMFEGLLDLIDARTLQRNREIVENYKMIIQKLPVLSDSNSIDEFAIEIDTALKFYNMLLNALPEGVGAALSPMDIDTIDFKPDDNSASVLASAMNSLFDDSGVSEMLFNSSKSGSVGLDASIKTDIALAWQLVESIEQWIQRYIRFKKPKFEYDFEILRVDIFNKEKNISSELSLANSGIPNKIKLAATAGISPVKLISSTTFENDILGLHEKFIPLQTSYTMSSSIEETAIEDLSDSGAKSRDLQVNKNEV